MISDPILININTPDHKVENIVNRKVNKLKRLKYGIRHVIFVDSKKEVALMRCSSIPVAIGKIFGSKIISLGL